MPTPGKSEIRRSKSEIPQSGTKAELKKMQYPEAPPSLTG